MTISQAKFFLPFVESKQPIEELGICDVDVELAKILAQLKTIKVLHIETSEDILIYLIKQLPALEYLHFKGTIRLSLVKKVLQHCEKMKKLEIDDRTDPDRPIDLNDYDSIVALATGRVEVTYTYRKIQRYTDENRQIIEKLSEEKTNKWIRIMHI